MDAIDGVKFFRDLLDPVLNRRVLARWFMLEWGYIGPGLCGAMNIVSLNKCAKIPIEEQNFGVSERERGIFGTTNIEVSVRALAGRQF